MSHDESDKLRIEGRPSYPEFLRPTEWREREIATALEHMKLAAEVMLVCERQIGKALAKGG